MGPTQSTLAKGLDMQQGKRGGRPYKLYIGYGPWVNKRTNEQRKYKWAGLSFSTSQRMAENPEKR